MNTSLHGIVLTGMRYGERSRIVRIFTREQGMLSFVIHPERSKRKSSRAALYQPLTMVGIEAKIHAKKDLHSIRDIRLTEATISLHMQPEKSSQAMFVAELVAKCLQESDENTDLFDYLTSAILWLDSSEHANSFHLGLLLGLCRFWGFYPQTGDGHGFFDLREGRFKSARPMHRDIVEGALATQLEGLCGMDFDVISAKKMKREWRNEMVEILLKYYSIHIAHFNGLHSHRILQETFGPGEE